MGILDRRWQQFDDLRTLAQITIRRDTQVRRLFGVLLLKAPDSLRFEALSPWGQPVLLLASTQESFTLYEVGDNRAVIGPASARTIERWIGIPLEPGELVGVLSGHLLPMPDPRRARLLPADDRGPSIELAGSRGVQRIWLDTDTGIVRQVEWNGSGRALRVGYPDRGVVDPPSAVTLTALDRSLTVTIRYKNPQIGVGLTADHFRLSLPNGAKIRHFR